MSNWEYKVITSGKGGFASPTLLEKFLNDLGQEAWEIIQFHTQPDNPLAFTGLARRTAERDWTLEDAAKAAARAEANKLRAEFEAKFKAANSSSSAPAGVEPGGETFLAEEKVGTDDGFRRLRDTSRDSDPDAPEEESGAPKDEWDQLAAEDELPTFFDALRPHMRRNQRGPGMSVGVDYLAKKWKLDEADIKGALVECGMQIPADENAKPVYVEYEGDLFWVNINRRGEIWINTREKPQPVFRVVQAKRVAEEPVPALAPAPAPAADAAEIPASQPTRAERMAQPEPRPAAAPLPAGQPQTAPMPRTYLGKLRGLMRRNRRGQGWSGSFPFLTKALKIDQAGLLAHLAEHGVTLAPDGAEKPIFHEEDDFLYWMNKNQRGEIWINARRARRGNAAAPSAEDVADDELAEQGEAPASTPESAPAEVVPGSAPAAETVAPVSAAPSEIGGTPVSSAPAPAAATGHALAAVRLLLQPKKRGEGVTARVAEVAAQLGQPEDTLLEALVSAGLSIPQDAKEKPKFGENNGEIFWLNRSTRGELWINAKASKPGRRARGRKKSDEEAGAENPEPDTGE